MSWEPRHEKLYKGGVLLHHKVQHTPDGPWEDYVPEEPPPVKAAQSKAFPNVTGQQGMDLRDYFAAHALTGAQIWDAVLNGQNSVLARDGVNRLAEVAYLIADAMMKAREQ
jgi:hypothetical protein